VTVSLLTALFTGLSARAASNDVAGVRDDLSFGLRMVGLFTVIAAAVLMVLALPFARVLLPTANASGISALATVVVVMMVGLPAFGAWSMAQRVFYAYTDAKSMVPIQVVMAGIVALGAVGAQTFAPPRYWVAGAGLAMSVSYAVGAVIALLVLGRRLHGIGAGRVVRLYVRAGLAAAVAAGLGWLGVQAVGGLDTGRVRALVICVVVGLVMSGVYVGLLKLMRVRELDDLLRPLLRRVGRSA